MRKAFGKSRREQNRSNSSKKFSGQIQICPLNYRFFSLFMLNYSQTTTFGGFLWQNK